ncbi:site-specific integrase [soil metagenome]
MADLTPYTPSSALTSPETDLLALYLMRFDRAHTCRSYRADLEHFFGKALVSLADARPVDFIRVNAYLAELEVQGYAASTMKRRLACIRGFFQWLVALGLISQNPADRHVVRRIRSVGTDHAITVLTREDARRLLESVDPEHEAALRDSALLQVLLHCVLRRSEAAAMDVEHVRMVGRYWVIDLPHTKGGANQYVKIPVHVVEALDNVRSIYGIVSGPIWLSLSKNSSRGSRLSGDAVYQIVRRAVRRAGLSDRIGAHTLRHTGCTLAIESGANVVQVQAHARHKNVQTTMAYIHQSDRLRDSAADYIKF